MAYQHSVVLVVADGDRVEAEAFGAMLGHSGQEYRVPLSADGAEPASHFGLHTYASNAFIAVLNGSAPGLDPADHARLQSIVSSSIRTESAGHFSDAVLDMGLQRIIPTEDPADL